MWIHHWRAITWHRKFLLFRILAKKNLDFWMPLKKNDNVTHLKIKIKMKFEISNETTKVIKNAQKNYK